MLEEPYFIPSLIGAVLLLQVMGLFALLRLSGRVSRLYRAMDHPEPQVNRDLVERKEENSEQKKLFAAYLEEDPARRELPKKEQFAGFRRWREAKGLNWKNPDSGKND